MNPILTVTLNYSNLQSKDGHFIQYNENGQILDSGRFTDLDISGNTLVLYGSDNGATKKGRINKTINLSIYSVKTIAG